MRPGVRVALPWTLGLILTAGFGAMAGSSAGIYVRSSGTVYLGWDAAWRVGALFAIAYAVMTLGVGFFVQVLGRR